MGSPIFSDFMSWFYVGVPDQGTVYPCRQGKGKFSKQMYEMKVYRSDC